MCGIAGFVASSTYDALGSLELMAEAIRHRGPDDHGFYRRVQGNWQVALAHRRLSIIDLSTGHQPIGNEDGQIQVVFNGEIYNFQSIRNELIACGHRFATESDTETIVHAYEQWGMDCLKRFRGMFAFALWDARNCRLVLARDRFGKKPLFVFQSGDRLFFASEIKALLACQDIKADVDEDSIYEYLAYRYVPGPSTLFKGIRKLMPGCFGTWERGNFVETRYYSPPDKDTRREQQKIVDPIAGFMAHLEDAVQIRMVADVPFGAFLSGGIDSSAVVGLMARHSGLPIKTFSVGFSDSAYSELAYAKTIAEAFSTEHHELVITEDDVMAQLPRLVRYRDAPVSEPSDIPICLLSKEARKTVKMVLTGEGADEMLGGYPKHVFERYSPFFRNLPSFASETLLPQLARRLPYRFHRAKTALANLGVSRFEERMPRWFGALSKGEIRSFSNLQGRNGSGAVHFDTPGENTSLRRILYFDQASWLPDNLLERGDRMTMAASLEARMPFMDHELAEYVSGLPDKYRVRGRQTKWILRQAMRSLLPDSILKRPKVGFRVPVNDWFRGPMRDFLYEHLVSAGSRTSCYFRQGAVERVLEEHVRGFQNHEKLLWALLNLEIWHRNYIH